MTTPKSVSRTIHRKEKRVYSHGELVESWKHDHEEAEFRDYTLGLYRHETQDLLEDTIDIWKELTSLHRDWLHMVSSGQVDPDLEIDKRIRKLYVDYCSGASKLQSVMEWLALRKIDVARDFKHYERFLTCFDEVNEALTSYQEPTSAVGTIDFDRAHDLSIGSDFSMFD